ncbi:extracellular solute-binding protein [bacterium]|nr:extracellular solute-binding protein [bacterium]
MADKSNLSNSANLPATGRVVANQQPIFQASPSGGMVATLRPGQTAFDGVIRNEQGMGTKQVVNRHEMPAAGVAVAPMKAVSTNSERVAAGPKVETAAGEKTAAAPVTGSLSSQAARPQAVAVAANTGAAGANGVGPMAPKSVSNYRVGMPAAEKKPVNWLVPLLGGGLALIVMAMVGYYLYDRQARQPEAAPEVTETTILNYWGLWEPSSTLTQVIKDFEDQNPGISVNYSKMNIDTYADDLTAALESGAGPDVFRYHASWRPMLDEHLAALPATMMSADEYARTFYPVVTAQMTNESGEIKGIPLMYDSLALIYNRQLLSSLNIEPPKTWAQFRAAAVDLTYMNADEQITKAGAAMGLSDNVDFASDIIGVLGLQNGIDWEHPDAEALKVLLEYYANFYTLDEAKVWDSDFDNSTTEFARGNVAMIIGPSWLIHDILKINPNLPIGVTSLPQLDVDRPVDWATYYVEGVNVHSPRQVAAWKLLTYLSSAPVLEQLNMEQGNTRMFGEIYPRRDMADLLADNPYLEPFVVNAKTADNFYLNSRTYDARLNDDMRAILDKMLALWVGRDARPGEKNLDQFVESWSEKLIEYKIIPDPKEVKKMEEDEAD